MLNRLPIVPKKPLLGSAAGVPVAAATGTTLAGSAGCCTTDIGAGLAFGARAAARLAALAGISCLISAACARWPSLS